MEDHNFMVDYFKEKINFLRLKLHSMEGFEPVEKISENIVVPEEPVLTLSVKTSEKVNA